MINLVDELKKAFNGKAWHGNNIMILLNAANPQKVFTHPIPNAHSIAELVLHLTVWTEEVISRINGAAAKEPERGDWPEPQEKSESEWSVLLGDFKIVNQELIELVANLQPINWSTEVKDERAKSIADAPTNNAQLLNGLIQHHAYHAGQIALLLKF